MKKERYVAFFDIMGFKDLVERHDHSFVTNKLDKLFAKRKKIINLKDNPNVTRDHKFNETHLVNFSDSIVLFSEDDSNISLQTILLQSALFIFHALESQIPIKGAISFGEITFKKNENENLNIFFGRPFIDAYLLHDQLQLYSAVLDNKVEEKFNKANLHPEFKELIKEYKAPFKFGKVNHLLIHPPKGNLKKEIELLHKLYENVSGQPRIYIDNTIDFLK